MSGKRRIHKAHSGRSDLSDQMLGGWLVSNWAYYLSYFLGYCYRPQILNILKFSFVLLLCIMKIIQVQLDWKAYIRAPEGVLFFICLN